MLTHSAPPLICDSERRVATSVSYVWICDRMDADLEKTLDRYLDAFRSDSLPWTLTVVINGLGAIASKAIAEKLKQESIDARIIDFAIPTPESKVLAVALKNSTGDAIVLLPAYAQSDPEDIAKMIDALQGGLDYVASVRVSRVDPSHDQQRSKLFNSVTRFLTGIKLQDINSGLRVFRREVVDSIPLYGDLHIYLPILAAQQGFKVGEVAVRHIEERPGVSGQGGVGIYLRRALDLLTLFFLMRFTQKPFRFFGSIGTFLLVVGGGINLVLAGQKLFFHDELADRPMLVLATLLMVLGVQMFSLGLIGELIIFVNAGGVKDYQIENTYESDDNDEI